MPHPFRVELSNSKRNCPITYLSTTVTYFLAINSTRDHGHDDGQTDCRADTHDPRRTFLSRARNRCVNSVALGRRIKGSNRLNRCSGSTLPTRTAYTFTRHLAVAVASLFIRNSGLAGSRSENLGWPYLPERNGHWTLGIDEDADVESYFRRFYRFYFWCLHAFLGYLSGTRLMKIVVIYGTLFWKIFFVTRYCIYFEDNYLHIIRIIL